MRPQKRTPCNRICEVEWGSKTCMQKRGYIWNYALNKWSRDENGNVHKVANPECDYVMQTQLSWKWGDSNEYIDMQPVR